MSAARPANAEVLRDLDVQFGEWVARHFSAHLKTDSDKKQLQEVAAAVSHAAFLKHSCLDLRQKPLPAGVITDVVQPLVVSADGCKVWLQKYHAFESGVATHLLARAAVLCQLEKSQQQHLPALFDQSPEHLAAAEKALTHNLSIITGGPGTGKTWTVARIIVSLLEQNAHTRILLAAPTGKAGARMKQSMVNAFENDAVMRPYRHWLEVLPKKAATLDALLQIRYGSPKAHKHRENPLACDVLIVDEASMIALPMMYRLLEALPPAARLILLGDKDQLASVEAGSVLGDICASTGPIKNCIAEITRSKRFGEHSEIGILSRSLKAQSVILAPTREQVRVHILQNTTNMPPAWLSQAMQGYSWITEAITQRQAPEQILHRQTGFQILCALRVDVNRVNEAMARSTHHGVNDWYEGRPVMITQNDHDRNLHNGDVGMVLKVADALKACFWVDGELKCLSRAQMPPHETCYAITVHKSQGSEYDHVLIVLPTDSESLSPVLTQELVYTAVTRAKEKVDIWCGEGVLDGAAKKTIVRMSGLREMLEHLP